MTSSWGADVPISMPIPPGSQVIVPMFGFGMSRYGICHDMSEDDYMVHRSPTYAPDVSPSTVVYDDMDLDN